MADRTPQQRFDQALAHIRNLSDDLAEDIKGKGLDKATAGAEISLGGGGFWKSGSAEQHMAVRGVMLCLIAYFRTPHSKFDFASPGEITTARDSLKGRTLQQVNEEILYYLPKDGAKLADLADAAIRVDQVSGIVNVLKRTRTDNNVSLNPVCYHGVSTWLFASGFVSKRWFAKEGSDLTGYTANRYLGQGTEVPQTNWGRIPRGYIFNIHKQGDPSTCHWGVSLGEGMAVGCNNTDGSPGQDLTYRGGGNTHYGVFNFAELCTLLNKNTKYKMDKFTQEVGELPVFTKGDHESGINIVVRQINPEAMAAVYY